MGKNESHIGIESHLKLSVIIFYLDCENYCQLCKFNKYINMALFLQTFETSLKLLGLGLVGVSLKRR